MDSRFRSSMTQKSRVYSQLRIFSELDQELNVVRHNLRAEYDTTIIRTKFNFCVEYDADSGPMTKQTVLFGKWFERRDISYLFGVIVRVRVV